MRFKVGDIVSVFYDEGANVGSGSGDLYGVVYKAGKKAFYIRWESSNTNRQPQDTKRVKHIKQDPELIEEITQSLVRRGIIDERGRPV